MKNKAARIILSASTVLALMAADGVVDGKAVAASTVTIGIDARIIDSALIITNTAPLSFGAILLGGTGTVTVNPDGSPAGTTGTLSLVGGAQAGAFKIRGPIGQTATFTLNPKTVILTDGGGATMKVDNFRLGTASKVSGTYTIPLNGTFQTGNTIGGRLTVGPAKPAGTYSGSVTITATGT